MTKLTMDEKEYEMDNFTQEQLEMVRLLSTASDTQRLLEFIMGSVNLVRDMKYKELKESLESEGDAE